MLRPPWLLAVGVDVTVIVGAGESVVPDCAAEVVSELDDGVDVGTDTVAATLYELVAVVGTADHRDGAIAENVSPVTVPLQPLSPQQFQRSEVVL